MSQGDEPATVPVVGIGASAGGLEAFMLLVKHVPLDTGLAFVLVQHLDPKHESMLGEILSRATRMPVEEVKDGVAMQANHVYVIPPNTSMTVAEGVLKLMPREQSAAPQMPIDLFFRSLAESYKNKAIGVILSGTGSDGALGLEAIKAEGGITFAQDRKSAKFGSMPQQAVATGCVDFVLPPEKIAGELARMGQHPYVMHPETAEPGEPSGEAAGEFGRVFELLRDAKGVDFSLYKQSTVKRRIRRRLALLKIENLEDYVRFLEEKPAELDVLHQEILVQVTSFFRDPAVFAALASKALPQILENRTVNGPIRIWVPGCAAGEEAFSLAICLVESMAEAGTSVPIQIFASDISETAIAKARNGLYLENVAADVTPERLARYFLRTDAGYQVSKAIRELCVFTRQDLIKDPPFSRLDLVSCRNVLIYLGSVQKKIIPLFHYALKPKGFLLLGTSETARSYPALFAAVDAKCKIYRKKEVSKREYFRLAAGGFPLEIAGAAPKAARATPDVPARSELQRKVDHILLAKYNPAGVVIDEEMEVIEIRGQAGRYLEIFPGKATFNLLKMAHPASLALELRAAFEEARQTAMPARRERIEVEHGGQFRNVNIEVIPLDAADRRTYLVLFEESPARESRPVEPREEALTPEQQMIRIRERQITKLQEELTATRDHLLSIIDDYESTREENQVSSEEALSTNEELQSINEELETAKEELQATNEELLAVNDELQNGNVALQQSRDFAFSIVDAVHQPLLVLDAELRVRKANESFYRFFGVPSAHVERRSFYALAGGSLDVPGLRALLEGVLPHDASFRDFEVAADFPKIGPKAILLSGRRLDSLPMILVAMEDITGRKEAEAALRLSEDQLRQAQKMEVIGRLAGGIAHDFNNLLTVILGHSASLLEGLHGEEDRLDLVEIKAAAGRAASLTQQLLAFSRRQVLQPKLLDVNVLIADFEKMLRRLIGEHIELVIGPNSAEGRVKVDPGQLGRVIMNLALNARDAMPQGGTLNIQAINVDLDEAHAVQQKVAPGCYVMLSISDTGIGMDAETQSHLFEPFFTTKEKHAGTGLGLSVVQGIVEQSGGVIRLYSVVGRGTTFRIYLPRAEGPEVLEAGPGEASQQAPRGSEAVLLVEDEGGVRRLARLMLEQSGYTVLEASHGREALSICESHEGPVHVLVTDVMMPGMGGRELADHAALVRPEMKVLFISGHTNDVILEQGIKRGAAFLQKPFSRAQLTQKVREVLDGKASGARQA